MHRSIICLTAILAVGSVTGVNAQSSKITLDDATRDRCLSVLRKGMQGDDFWPSIHAAEGLTLAGMNKEVISHLKPLLKKEMDDQHRCGLARELVRAGQKKHKQVMLKILAGEDSHGHIHAAESLYKVAEIGDGKALQAAWQNAESKPVLRLMAAAAVAKHGDKKAMDFLRTQLSSDDPDTYRLAAWILGRIGDETDIPRLKKRMSGVKDELVRCYLEHSLAALGDAEGRAALLRNLGSKDPAIRTYAATFAGDARMTNAQAALTKMLDDEHPDAAIRAAQTLLVLASPTKR